MWLHFISLTLYIFRGALSTFTVLSTLVIISLFQFLCSVQSLSQVQPFATPWTAARQASLSITNSRSLLKLMSIESVMPSNHLILCHLLVLLPSIFPSIRVSPVSQFFTSRGQTTGVSISASVFPKNIQDWFPLGWTGWTSLQSKGLSRVFSNTTVQKHQFFGALVPNNLIASASWNTVLRRSLSLWELWKPPCLYSAGIMQILRGIFTWVNLVTAV